MKKLVGAALLALVGAAVVGNGLVDAAPPRAGRWGDEGRWLVRARTAPECVGAERAPVGPGMVTGAAAP